MKINLDIDCTPEEARAFLGLPDVQPMQQAVMESMQRRMEQAIAGTDLEQLAKMWLPLGLQGLEQMQRAFWQAASGAGGGEQGRKKS